MTFPGEEFVSITPIDLEDRSGYQSSIDEVIDSELIARLRENDFNGHLSRDEHHHWVISTYDDIIEVVAESIELEVGPDVHRAAKVLDQRGAVALRAPTDEDWPSILKLANEALPQAPDGNAGWLEARRSFDSTARRRRHYVAEVDGAVAAYGGVEESDDPVRWRMFLVMSAQRLLEGLGDRVLTRLLHDVRDFDGSTVWLREQADDAALLAFVSQRGSVEVRRFVVRDGSTYDGVEVVELERAVDPDSP